MTVALYPGSFDPLHNGHLSVIAMAAPLFDRVIVGVGYNPDKPSGLFTPDERCAMIVESVADLSNVAVELFSGLVTDAARRLHADCLIKGLRGGSDLDVEMQQAHMNLASARVPTLFLPGLGNASLVASSYVRQIASMGGDVAATVPGPVLSGLQRKFNP
jgi:pantetheine-phosphate adenylyltransferase